MNHGFCNGDRDFKEEVNAWEERISNDAEDDDPLGIWDKYIKWTQQNATGETMSGKVVALLQRCTRRFQSDPRYKNDVRYLQIWVKYIDTVYDPSDIFSFLEANEIGKDLALLYTSWAFVLELKKGMFSEAYNKLEEGLGRRAKPVEQIQCALQQFQHRMNRRTIEAIKDAALDPAMPLNSSKPDIREFGDQISKSRRLVKPAAPVNVSISSLNARVANGSSSLLARGTQSSLSNSRSTSGFSVFVDSDAGMNTDNAALSSWNYLPSEREKVKENMRAASQWTKEAAGTIPVKRVSSAVVAAQRPRIPRAGIDFELFVEDNFEASASSGKGIHVHAQDKPLQPIRAQIEGMQASSAATSRRHVCPLEHLGEESP